MLISNNLRTIFISLISVRNVLGLSLSTSTYPVSDSAIIPSGVFAVFKPIGWTSNDVVTKIKNVLVTGEKQKLNLAPNFRYKSKLKVGHGGTLDPLAEGVLVLGIGNGTKLMQGYLSGNKGYSALGLLGSETDTQDSTGKIIETKDCPHITYQELRDSLVDFRGKIMQTPPMYSALKKNGIRLYELARKGIEVEREARQVEVYKLDLTATSLPEFGLEVECSGGLYIRSLIVDIARSVDARAHMTKLLRTRQGVFTLQDCLHQNDWVFEKICEAIVNSNLKHENLNANS